MQLCDAFDSGLRNPTTGPLWQRRERRSFHAKLTITSPFSDHNGISDGIYRKGIDPRVDCENPLDVAGLGLLREEVSNFICLAVVRTDLKCLLEFFLGHSGIVVFFIGHAQMVVKSRILRVSLDRFLE